MTNGTEKSVWTQLSSAFADAITELESSIVAIDGGGRSTSSGVVWRPGVIVTTHHALRFRENLKILLAEESLSARWIGSDITTDLAVLGIDSDKLTPVSSTNDLVTRAGEVVLSIGRSRLGDISASCGIIARTGSAWRSWRGGAIDRLIRPDIRLYVGQAGSALVNEQRQVLGINSPALASQAVITIPAQTINRVVKAILELGHVPRPFLGLAMQPIPIPEPAQGLFPNGVDETLLVTHVEPKAPAALAGVMVGDVIVSFNGGPVPGLREILHRLRASRIGDTISLTVSRGGARVDLTLSVADRG
ncbi:PDZ domain-containing protein [Alloacidobacterium dinghuense]|uniref:PDZ domain-containing protein n=1 Tax=Alloacidobacterium dinghuense TaxID=2763107 RepID=A0A7G8BJV2_9BACT|nr:trypsin-like peptidase domain-containing protein [Alloacidobacterium dinghuense]QNI32822.1 PDZ domain-containing protein [Alloacidobacterium dinghuense]